MSVQRSFLRGRTMGEAVKHEQDETLDLLASHDRLSAQLALTRGNYSAWSEWMTLRGAMLAGGIHRVRLTGGRGIDR